jgi:dipeptidyl aminopeptidase/acylaminoacyl peptidase
MSPTVTEEPPVGAPPDDAEVDPEALIREARIRQRRRRLRAAVAVLGVAGTGAAAYGIVNLVGGSTPAIEHVPNGPTVSLRAFSHHGKLAFVSHGKLWLLDGANGKLRELPSPPGFAPRQPIFSPDGRWLAYLEQHTTASSLTSHVWIAKADGSDAHPLLAVQTYTLIGWKPSVGRTGGDLLAIAAGGRRPNHSCPCGTPTTLRVVAANGSSRVLARANWIYGGAWSPDGRSIAAAEIFQRLSKLVVQPLNGAAATVWLSRRADQRLNGMTGTLFEIAGWWPGVGIGFWAFGNGAIHNNDETDLNLISAPGAKHSVLAPTLSDGTTVEFAGNGHGIVAVVADVSNRRNGGREFSDKKWVQLRTAAARCKSLVPRRSKVTVDPAWSPSGQTLAFVEAPDYVEGWPRMQRWYADHKLLLYSTLTNTIRFIPLAKGATVPVWSRNGASLLYEAHNALWLLPLAGAKPVRIVKPLFATGKWPAYYTQVAWSAQFAWSSP